MLKQLFENLPVKKTLLYLLLLITIVTMTYSNHFKNSFHFDDSHTIQNNLYIQNINNIPLFFKDATTFSSLPTNQSYRPVVSTSLAIDYWIGNGYDLFYFHLSSFLLYLLQGILLFFLIFRLFDHSYKTTINFYLAAAATLWYMVHPANAETINYIIARSDLQSTFFVVLAFVLYIFSPFAKKTHLYLIPVIIGALAKPPAVMFAPLLFFYVLFFEQQLSLMDCFKKQNRKAIWYSVKMVVPSFIVCVLMYLWIAHFTPETWQSGGSSAFNYLITQPFVILHYFITFFLPFELSADTDWEALTTIWNVKFFIGCAFILLMIFIAFIFSRDKRLRPVSFGIIWFFLALVPSSSIIPFAEVLNDHRIFFPYIGLVISTCWIIGLLIQKYKKSYENAAQKYYALVGTAACILLFGYAYGTHERNKVWNTEETLWKDVTIKSPRNGRGLMNYGLSQMTKGNYPEAEKYFTGALKLWPAYPFLHINLGVLKAATGDKITAEQYFKNAIQYGPNYPDSWYFYGRFLCEQSRYSEAIPMLTKSIELSDAHIGAREQLMKAYSETGKWNELNQLATQTLQIIPGNANAIGYLELSQKRKNDPAIIEEEAIKNPSPDNYINLSLEAYNQRNFRKCIEFSKKAILLNPNSAEAYNNIGSSYNMLQQYDSAITACKKAIELKPDFQLAKNNLQEAIKNKDVLNNVVNSNTKKTAEDYLNLSLIYYQQGAYEKCIEACKNALQLKPDYADAYSNIGASYNQLKQWDKAIDACNKALKINPQHKLANGNLNWAKEEKAKSR